MEPRPPSPTGVIPQSVSIAGFAKRTIQQTALGCIRRYTHAELAPRGGYLCVVGSTKATWHGVARGGVRYADVTSISQCLHPRTYVHVSGVWTNVYGKTRYLNTVADVEDFMAANDLQCVGFDQWGRFTSINHPDWQPNLAHDAQQPALVPPPPPPLDMDLLGRRVRKNLPGYGFSEGEITGTNPASCKYQVTFDDDPKIREYGYKTIKSILMPVA